MDAWSHTDDFETELVNSIKHEFSRNKIHGFFPSETSIRMKVKKYKV